MDIKQFLKKLFGKAEVDIKKLPTSRISTEPIKPLIPKTLETKYRFINPSYPREWLSVIEKAVIANPILSQVHNIIVNLANTGHDVKVEGKDAEKATQELSNLRLF